MGFDLREDEEEVSQKTIIWHSLPKKAGKEESTLKEEEAITSIQEEETSSMLDKEHILITAELEQVLRTKSSN